MKQEISNLLKDKKIPFIEAVKKKLSEKAVTEKEVYKKKNATRFIAESYMTETEISGEDNYKFTHGKSPSGVGTWIFSKAKNVDMRAGTENTDYIMCRNVSYTEAKRCAIKWAKENSIRTIYVQT